MARVWTQPDRVLEYDLCWNNDFASCLALAAMIADDWEIKCHRVRDGFQWFELRKILYRGALWPKTEQSTEVGKE
mgnify:FL=1